MNDTAVRSTPKDVFLHLARTLLLYAGVFGFIALLFQYIDMSFSGPRYSSSYYAASAIRWLISLMVVVFPVFMAVSWMIEKTLVADAQKLEMKVRKWFLSLTLFLSGAVMVSDMVYLIYDYLDGDFTSKFVLKSLTVLAVLGMVFGYYLMDLKRKDVIAGRPRLLASAVSVMVLASFVFGFYTVGTPGQRRNQKFDETRMYDLSHVKDTVLQYWRTKGVLPQNPEELKAVYENDYGKMPTDPQTGAAYEYRVVGNASFELCATFKTKNDGGYSTRDWNYHPGKSCFTIKTR